jgi:hypothetical protein
MVAGVVIGVIAGVGILVGAYMNMKTKAALKAAGGVHKVADHEGNTDTYNPMTTLDIDTYVTNSEGEYLPRPQPVTPPALKASRKKLRKSVSQFSTEELEDHNPPPVTPPALKHGRKKLRKSVSKYSTDDPFEDWMPEDA